MNSLRSVLQQQRRRRLLVGPSLRRRYATKSHADDATSSSSFHPLAWYSKIIDSHPLLVKCTTACLVAGAGDVANQKLQNNSNTEVDWAQTARFAGMNLCVVGPTLHFWYRWLAQRYPGNSLTSVAKRVVWDEFIFTPVYYPIFLSVLWKLEQGAALTQERIVHMLWNEMPHLIVVEWMIYIPAQALNFRFVPVKFQVLFSNLVGIVWNGFLSGMAQHAQVKEQAEQKRDTGSVERNEEATTAPAAAVER